jgi:hypothetical protein
MADTDVATANELGDVQERGGIYGTIAAGLLLDPRQASPEQELLGKVLIVTIEDLSRRHEHCARYQQALAWTAGQYACGCPADDSTVSLELVAEAFGTTVVELRPRILAAAVRLRAVRAARGARLEICAPAKAA